MIKNYKNNDIYTYYYNQNINKIKYSNNIIDYKYLFKLGYYNNNLNNNDNNILNIKLDNKYIFDNNKTYIKKYDKFDYEILYNNNILDNIIIYLLDNIDNIIEEILFNNIYYLIIITSINNNKEIDNLYDKIIHKYENFYNEYNIKEEGIVIMAPTFGELDAMYKTFQENKIPIRQMLVGIIKEKHLKRIIPTILKMDKDEYKTICYFGELTEQYCDILRQQLNEHKINLIHNKVVFQLIEMWKEYMEHCIKTRKANMIQSIKKQFKTGRIIFPCELKIFPEYVFMKGGNGNIILGVTILTGTLYKGTPLICNGINLGHVTGIEKDKKQIDSATVNDEVCIKIVNGKRKTANYYYYYYYYLKFHN
jgi:translation initiation factor IF-2